MAVFSTASEFLQVLSSVQVQKGLQVIRHRPLRPHSSAYKLVLSFTTSFYVFTEKTSEGFDVITCKPDRRLDST